jgi:hypothetical protein
MSGIFISYRRDDSRGTAGRLYDDLKDHFGKDRVFRDLDAIGPGVDYAQAIDGFIESCDAVVVIIGNQWLDIRNDEGRRRLSEPHDVVRQEIVAALKADKLVIPVLVEDAHMPAASRLPRTLAPLARRNALPVSDARWDYDVGLLVTRLEEVVPAGRRPAPPLESGRSEDRSLTPPPPPPPDRAAYSARSSPPPPSPASSGWSSGEGWSRPTPTPSAPGPSGGSSVPGWAWAAGVAVLVVVVGVVVAVAALGGNGSKGPSVPGPATVPNVTAPTVTTSDGADGPPEKPAGETSVTVSPASGPVGTSVTVSGTGFDPVETVEIRFHVGVQMTKVTDARGAFSDAVIRVPSGSFKGFPYSVTVTGKRSIKSASAPFNVT